MANTVEDRSQDSSLTEISKAESSSGFESSQTQKKALDSPLNQQNCEEEDDEEDEDEEEGNCRPGSEPQNSEHLDPDWVEERFRIDRKKLETMLYVSEGGEGLTAEQFFEKVMKETNTQVKWPSKLKIGAKSKKDPHVKVEGKRTNVLEAKKKILELLETKVNKVTLKMDVTYTEHSHVIGKGGGNIKKVMEVTSCHIHFPDSNRHNANGEKSNQVSIAGPVQGVESARKQIRDLQPLALTFDLPVGLLGPGVVDPSSPIIQHVAQAFGVNVSFRTQHTHYCTSCVVRGLQGNSSAVKKATCVLMELLLGSEMAAGVTAGVTSVGGQGMMVVSTQLDVTSQQHLFLLGQNGANFLSVMHQTHTQIILPDLTAPQHPPSLLIQGTPDGVCLARQQLMDCLPVCLMFDMKQEGEMDPRVLAQMMQNLGVFISIKPKAKQTAKSVVVKGLEKSISCLYEARRLLLGLESSEVTVMTKPACNPLLTANGMTGYWLSVLMQQLRLSGAGALTPPEGIVGSVPGKPRPSPPPGLATPSEEGRIVLRGTDSKLEKILENEDHPSQLESEGTGALTQEVTEATEMTVKPTGLNRRKSQSETSKGQKQEACQPITLQNSPKREMFVGLNRDRRCSLRILPCQDNAEEYDYEKKKLLATRAMQKKPVVTEVRTPTDTWSGLGFSKSMPAEAIKELRSVNRRCYKSYLSNQQSWSSQNGSDSENWRERRGSASPSSPTSSSSSPTSLSSSISSFSTCSPLSARKKTSKSYLSCVDYPEGMGRPVIAERRGSCSPTPQQTDDLSELLDQLGLSKYSDVFQQQEIDFQTFLTLSDEDLKEVGVSTFGARRKMLLAISDLKKSKRKVLEPPAVRPGYLEGGASGRLPRIMDTDIAAQSNRW
ncbi:bicaudal C homolog 2 [Chanos chanos]|uniref:Bicaudal C homolog 2 n=1 Tax=Chanos chanos TaxID=29144 RepID=A0A6J2UME8_CHACN|nr:protein bicaudal C homolog 1-B-like [Chanos chanos]